VKTKEIIKNVCVYLGKEELLNSSFFEENGEELTENLQKDLRKILMCVNMVTEEIASNYLPIFKTATVEITDGSVNLYEIDNKIQEIVSVKTKSGKNVRYKLLGEKMICLAKCVEIIYKVYPNEQTLEGDAENFSSKLSARVIAYGVASEYCFLEMLYDDATLWEHRYKNALLEAQRKKGEIKLKKRGWF